MNEKNGRSEKISKPRRNANDVGRAKVNDPLAALVARGSRRRNRRSSESAGVVMVVARTTMTTTTTTSNLTIRSANANQPKRWTSASARARPTTSSSGSRSVRPFREVHDRERCRRASTEQWNTLGRRTVVVNERDEMPPRRRLQGRRRSRRRARMMATSGSTDGERQRLTPDVRRRRTRSRTSTT